MSIPSHVSPHPPNPSIPPFMLDGGVYQGHPPTTQSNDWNPNTKVKLISFMYKKNNFFSSKFR